MKLSIKALALSSAILWAGVIFVVGGANIIFPGYGTDFLGVVGSIYPGYKPETGMSSVIIGTLYGVVDAGIGGVIFAWIYNFFAE